MLRPDIFAGIKQPDNLACLLVRSRNVRALMRVAMQARERKIVEGGLASVLACNHVVDTKRFVRWRSNMAIFASGSGTLTDVGESLDSRITGFQRNSRVRLQNRQKVRDVQIAIQFGALLTRESAGRG